MLIPMQPHIFTHADELLHDLAMLRDETDTVGRGLVFVAHSLGGIVLKEVYEP